MSNRINYYQAAPAVMKAMLAVEEQVGQVSLEKSLRELIKIRASQLNGCAFCVDMHCADAVKNGEDPRRIFALSAWQETPFFSERERAALLWTETLTLVAEKHAPDEIYQEVAKQFNPQELAELTFCIGIINAWNRFGVGFAMQPKA